MTVRSLKHHFALWPLFVTMALGMAFVGANIVRGLTKTHDISWKKEAEPYNAYRSKQYKFINSSGYDYSKLGTEIPKYKD